MAQNKGKKWEEKFKESWIECFPDTFIYRIPDQQSRHKGASKNPCDFLAFPNKDLYMIELKSHKGNTFPFDCFKQYELLLEYKDIQNVKCCLIVWFIEHNKVIYVPIEEVEKMKSDDKKSINIKMLDTKEYNIIEIPSIIKRTYPRCDFTILENNE